MLKVVQAAAESAGILTPSVADASDAAQAHRRSLVEAQAKFEVAELGLQSAFDRNADRAELVKLEAALAGAKVNLARAEGRYVGAEKRLRLAEDADNARSKEAAIARRDAALARRQDAARRIDELAALIAKEVAVYDGEASALSECARLKVANSSVYLAGGRELVRNALERVGAMPSRWLGDKADQPGAAAIAERDAGAIVAGITP